MKVFANDLKTIYLAPDEKTAVKQVDDVTEKWKTSCPGQLIVGRSIGA